MVVVVVVVVDVVFGDVGSEMDSGPSPGEHDAATTAPTLSTHIQRTRP